MRFSPTDFSYLGQVVILIKLEPSDDAVETSSRLSRR